MSICECGTTLQATGTPNKQSAVSSGSVLIAVYMKADDGTANQILATDTIDQAYIDARINDTDASKRWYPIGEFKSPQDSRADPISESFSDNSTAITQQGLRTYTGYLINFAPVYAGTLDRFACSSFGVYSIDSCGNLTGSINSDGTALRPIRVNGESWEPRYMKGNPTEKAKIQLMFEFSQLEKDKYLRNIAADSISGDILNVTGLLPISASISSPSTTGFTATLTVDFDVFLNSDKVPVEGFTVQDFKLVNRGTGLEIAITSVTEGAAGVYTFVIPVTSAGTNLELTNVRTSGRKPGFFLESKFTN